MSVLSSPKRLQRHHGQPLVLVLSAIAMIGLSACASPVTNYPEGTREEIDKEVRLQKEMALKVKIEETRHLQGIAYKINTANAALCEKPPSTMGMELWSEYSFPHEERTTANILYGVGDVLQVSHVYEGGPADQVGINPGDRIIAVDDHEIKQGKGAIRSLNKALKKKKSGDITLTLHREQREYEKTLNTVKTCPYDLVYDHTAQEVNAYADGKRIIIARGMYRFAKDDDELGLIIGHELAHNVMKHNQKKAVNAAIPEIIGTLTDIYYELYYDIDTYGFFRHDLGYWPRKIYSVAFEQEADYVSLYFAARAGYNIDRAPELWRRWAAELNSSNIKKRSTHPANGERFIAMRKAYEEIKEKQENGAPLEPHLEEHQLGLNAFFTTLPEEEEDENEGESKK